MKEMALPGGLRIKFVRHSTMGKLEATIARYDHINHCDISTRGLEKDQKFSILGYW